MHDEPLSQPADTRYRFPPMTRSHHHLLNGIELALALGSLVAGFLLIHVALTLSGTP